MTTIGALLMLALLFWILPSILAGAAGEKEDE